MLSLPIITPAFMSAVISVLIGLCVGSFLNVVVARLPQGRSIVRPRSACTSCGYLIRWYENIPVLSYLFLRARCSHCQAKISVRYPIIELLTALLFLACTLKHDLTSLTVIRDWTVCAILIAITFIDLEHRIIPDILNLILLILGLATAYFTPEVGIIQSLAGATLGFVIFYGMAWGYEKYSGRQGMGGGDIKFLTALGALFGPMPVLSIIFISSISGSLFGILQMFLSGSRSLKLSIPFGPFLVLGALVVLLLGDVIWIPFMNF